MNPELVPILVGGILLLLVIAAVRYALRKTAPSYKLQPSILTKGELVFWEVLRQSLPGNTMLAIKPRLADIFTTTGHTNRSSRQIAFNKISSKHVDFLLIDPQGKPLLGIELDDKSHDRKDRRERDRFVDRVFSDANLPILHITAKRDYSVGETRSEIIAALR